MLNTRRILPVALGLICVINSWAQMYAGKTNNWYKGNTHIHNERSGSVSKWYHDNDYDFINLSEHRTWIPRTDISFSPRRPEFIIIEGEEFNSTNSFGGAHVTVMNSTAQIGDIQPTNDKLIYYERVQALVQAKNGFGIMNHPTWGQFMTAQEMADIKSFKHFEVFSGIQDTDYYKLFPGTRDSAIEDLWDGGLTLGAEMYGVGSDDMHNMNTAGEASNPMTGWTMLKVEGDFNIQNILKAYNDFAFYASNGVILEDVTMVNGLYKVIIDSASTLIELKRRDDLGFVTSARPVLDGDYGFKIEFIGPGAEILKTVRGLSADFQISKTHSYVRVRATYMRDIPANGAPYGTQMDHQKYVNDNNITKEEYYAWGQPLFSDNRNPNVPLIWGCTDSLRGNYDPAANMHDDNECGPTGVFIEKELVSGEIFSQAINIIVGEEFGSYTIQIRDMKGEILKSIPGNFARSHKLKSENYTGMFVVSILGSKKTSLRKILLR